MGGPDVTRCRNCNAPVQAETPVQAAPECRLCDTGDPWDLLDRETGRVVRTFSASSVMGRHITSGRVDMPHGLLAHNLRTGEVIY